MSKSGSLVILILGVILLLGSCVPLGYSFYLNLLSQPSHTFTLKIGVPVKIDNVKLFPESFALLAVRGKIETQSVQEDDTEGDITYIARYKFPVTYNVTDHSGRVIKVQQTEIKWDTGSRMTTSKEVDSLGGKLDVRHNFDKFTIPVPGQINIEFLIGPDELYAANINSPQLLIYDGLADDLWLIGGGIFLFIIAIVLLVIGFVFILSTYAATNVESNVENETSDILVKYNKDVSNHQEKYVKAMWIHISGFSGYLIPFCNIILPVILWMIWKEEDSFIDDQGREAVNFQISVLIYIFICIPLLLVIIGFILLILVGIYHVVFVTVAALRSSQGIPFRYPMIIRFIK